MAYSMLGITDPRLFPVGDGGINPFQQFAQTFGQNVYGGMKAGMDLGTQLTRYGAQQRLAPYMERNALQSMNSQLLQSQNSQLGEMNRMQFEACNLTGWRSPQCQVLKARLQGQQVQQPYQQAAQALGLPQQTIGPDMGGFDFTSGGVANGVDSFTGSSGAPDAGMDPGVEFLGVY